MKPAKRANQLGPKYILSVSVLLLFLSPPANGQGEIEALNQKAIQLHQQGKYDEVAALFEEALKRSETEAGVDHPGNCHYLMNLGELYTSLRNYKKAERYFHRALQILEKNFGANDSRNVQFLVKRAQCFSNQGMLKEAEPLLQRSLKIVEQHVGKEHVETARSLNQLGELKFSLGDYSETEELFIRALEIREQQLGNQNAETAASVNNLAALYHAQGNYIEAEPLYERALQMREAIFGPEHPFVALTLSNQAHFFREQGKFDESEPLYRSALKIMEESQGPDHIDVALVLDGWALLYSAQGKLTEAEAMYRRALKIWEKHVGANHPDTAKCMVGLAEIYMRQDQVDKAEPLFRRALAISEDRLGQDHPYTARLIFDLGFVNEKKGNLAEAESMYLRALEIRESKLGETSPDTIGNVINLVQFYTDIGAIEKSRPFVNKVLAGVYQKQRQVFSYFSEQDCLSFQERIFLERLVGTIGSAPEAATHQILFKGAVQDAISRRRLMAEILSTSDEGKELIAKRRRLGEKLQILQFEEGPQSRKTLNIKKELDDVLKKIALLTKQRDPESNEVGLPEVTACLGDEILIEIFRYNHQDDPGVWTPRYSAVVIFPNRKPEYISLGDARTIEQAIRKYRKAVDFGSDSSEAQRLTDLREAEKVIHQKVIASVSDSIEPEQKLVFSLDSQLHFIPIHMIRDEAGISFGIKHRVRYVSSGRDLVRKTGQVFDKSALIVGNPNFEKSVSLIPQPEPTEGVGSLSSNLRNGMEREIALLNLGPLPGTAKELQLLESKFKTRDYQVTALSDDDASEVELKKRIQGAAIVHFATHGFFLNEITVPKESDAPNRFDTRKTEIRTIQDPMFRSGLALAGAQSTLDFWEDGKIPSNSEDGILMAAEANLLDLRRTDLVVLSACETAVGDSLDGEGIMGLRRAFMTAGVNSLVTTLWAVEDEATVEVMDTFYEKYLNGTHPSIALPEAQSELYEIFVERFGEVGALARLAPFVCTSKGQVN